MGIGFVRGDIQVTRRQTVLLPVSEEGKVENDYFHPLLRRYPAMVERMEDYCEKGLLVPGKLWLYRHSQARNVLVLPVYGEEDEERMMEGLCQSLDKLTACYREKGIMSLAVPLFSDSNDVLRLLLDKLSFLEIPIDVYDEQESLSQKILPCLGRLCGDLSPSQVAEIKEKICFEK